MLSHAKLEQIEDGSIYHRLIVDGTEIKHACACNINVAARCVPECVVTLNTIVAEFDGQADVKYDFTPATVQQAAAVLRNELLKHGNLWNGFAASIRSAVEEQFSKPDGATSDELVDAVLMRIVGED